MDGLIPGSRMAVGSLPQQDPQAAVDFQRRFFPEVPAWPQLPRRSPLEAMTRQGLRGLPGVVFPEPDRALWTLRPADTEEALELLAAENAASRLDRAALQPAEAPGFFAFLQALEAGAGSPEAVKGQCAGPITLGLALKDEEGKPLLSSKPHMAVLVEYLVMQARWQARRLSAAGKPVLFLVDEPSAGGLDPGDHGLSWTDLEGWYDVLFSRLQDEGLLCGIHACGPGPWDWVFRTPAEILHLDALRYGGEVERQAGEFARFLAGGGVIGWGLVPTARVRGHFPEPAELLGRWSDIAAALMRRGADPDQVAGRSFFSTACGLGLAPTAVAEEAVRCLDMLVTLWRVEAGTGFRGHF